MRPHHFAAIVALAIAPVIRAATAYDVLTYPLQYSGATVTLPSTTAGPSSVTSNQVGSVSGAATSNYSNAVLFSASYATPTIISLNPAVGDNTFALGTDATQQVGSFAVGSQNARAALWSGNASSMVLLNPTNFTSSVAVAVKGNEQVGTGYNGSSTVTQALLWTGTAASAIDLNASATQSTYIASTDGTHQVGGISLSGVNTAARLWTGTAASVIDLTPTDLPGLASSYAYGVSGNQQVGVGYATQPIDPFQEPDYQALVWNGSGASAVNLTPTGLSGINTAEALGTNGSVQCGFGYNLSTGKFTTALAWSGTAASAINLGSALPTAGVWTQSVADSVDSNGTIAGTATGAARGFNGSFGVNWFPSTSTGFHAVFNGQLFQFAPSTYSGIVARNVPGFGINSGGYAYIPAAITVNRQLLIISGNGLFIDSGAQGYGLFDITDNDLDLPVNSLSGTFQLIAQGYNNGSWNGSGGITSSTAAADTAHLTALGFMQNNQSGATLYTASHLFDGIAPGAGDVLVKYTYYGDANLDGKVDGSDYSRIDTAYLADKSNPAALTGWFNGDFNYDGIVDGSDYTLIDNAYNFQQASLDGSIAPQTAESLSQINDNAGTVVPEPASIALLGLTAVSALRRRRRFI